MYENNNNYTYTSNYTPEEPESPKNGGGKKAAKIIAAVLAVALVGGASGYGGAYLANSSKEAESVTASAEGVADTGSENKEDTAAVTASSQKSDGSENTSLGTLLNIDSADADTLSNEEIIQRATPSVALITSEFTQIGKGTGTGIVLSSDGYIITNCHVIETSYKDYANDYNPFDNPFSFFGGGYNTQIETKTVKADKVAVTLSDGSEHEAEIIGSDENTDLAILKIEADGLIPAVIGNSDELKLGETAITLGYPLGLGLSASGGMVSGLEKEISTELSNGRVATMPLIQTDASINAGNSGGPLLNSKGEVIGITSSKLVSSEVEGIGFAIPITDAMPVLDDLMNKGYVSTPKIGITGSAITSADQRYYNLPVNKGVLVVAVEDESCADKAGIEEGDIIVAADGKDITDMDALVAAKNAHKPGETMTVTLARSDGNIDIDMVLDETPQEEAE